MWSKSSRNDFSVTLGCTARLSPGCKAVRNYVVHVHRRSLRHSSIALQTHPLHTIVIFAQRVKPASQGHSLTSDGHPPDLQPACALCSLATRHLSILHLTQSPRLLSRSLSARPHTTRPRAHPDAASPYLFARDSVDQKQRVTSHR